MDWSHLAQASGEVTTRLLTGAAVPIVEVFEAGELCVTVEIDTRAASVAVLRFTDADGAGVASVARGLRFLIRRLFADDRISRVEVLVPADDARRLHMTTRTGLRREGILRGGLEHGAKLVDGALFAGISADPDPESAGGFTFMLDSILPTKRLISHVIMTDPAGRILLCQTTFKKDWELPGGVVEPGESPVLGALREVREEIGIDVEINSLLAMDWLPPYLGWSDAIELLYDAGEHPADLPDSLVCDPREIRTARWFDLDEAVTVTSDLNARRLPLLIPTKPSRTLHLEAGTLTHPH